MCMRTALQGGAIAAYQFGAVSITGSTLRSNQALGLGGALYTGVFVSATLADSAVANNTCGAAGCLMCSWHRCWR